MLYTAIFSIAVGVLMIGQWGVSLVKRNVAELSSEPIRIGFHLVAEFLTAAVLVLAGVALLAQSLVGYPLALLGLGMLLYTLINSPGYFAQKGQWPMVMLFVVLFILALLSLYELFSGLEGLIRIGS